MPQPPCIVFTDLDGTLLDHADYSWTAARPALDRLAELKVPVVLSSSKTAAEIAVLRDRMGLSHWPAVVENGAGLLEAGAIPDGPGPAYARLRAALDQLPGDLRRRFRGFGDMTTDEVARDTGLPPEAAELARRRGFSEPGHFDAGSGQLDAFLAALAPHGITGRRGGRYLTLSFGGTKADRMAEVAARFGSPPTIALGDAPNDVEMIEAADHGVIIANPHGPGLPQLPAEASGRIRRSTKPGPEGWNAMITLLLSELTD